MNFLKIPGRFSYSPSLSRHNYKTNKQDLKKYTSRNASENTFIALYLLTEMLDVKMDKMFRHSKKELVDNASFYLHNITVDIFETVFELRKKRMNMVCTKKILCVTLEEGPLWGFKIIVFLLFLGSVVPPIQISVWLPINVRKRKIPKKFACDAQRWIVFVNFTRNLNSKDYIVNFF